MKKLPYKKMLQHYDDYNKSYLTDIYNAYGKPSFEKVRAWLYCQLCCENRDGYNLKIVSHNTWMFTAGFLYEGNDGTYFVYIRPTGEQEIKLEEGMW